MNLHEYQAKDLLGDAGVAVPPADVCQTPEEARAAAEKYLAAGARRIVIKAQIHAGGRGKGVFKSGFRGGVKLSDKAEEIYGFAQGMLGQVLVTKQTGPEGRQVNRVLVGAAPEILEEFYLAILLDRVLAKPVVVASAEGGVDIEEVAEKHPEKIWREPIDPTVGMMPYQARKLARGLGLKGDLINEATKLLRGVYKTWWDCDASLIEINPLCRVKGSQGKESLLAVDAKMTLDDNALYRQMRLMAMRDLAQEAPLEIEASKFNLNYIKLDGNIACLVNGAGLAMATMDIIQHYGGKPANFLDVGGGASKDQVTAAFRIILSDPAVKGILVNIFGGIMQCDIIAQGIVAAAKETRLSLPLVVRLEGNNARLGKKIIEESGLAVIGAESLSEAAQKIVAAVG